MPRSSVREDSYCAASEESPLLDMDGETPQKYNDRLLHESKRRPSLLTVVWRFLSGCARRRRLYAPASYDEPMTYAQAMRLASKMHGAGRPTPTVSGTSTYDDVGMIWCHAPAITADRRPLCCSADLHDYGERTPPPAPPPTSPQHHPL